MDTIALILAAGKGTRMKSDKSKLVHKIYDKTLIERVVETAKKAEIDEVVAIVGYKKEEVYKIMKAKADKKGTFNDKIFLEYVDEEKRNIEEEKELNKEFRK